MMKTKGLKKKENSQFGLFFKNGKYFTDKLINQSAQKPFIKFKSFTQGSKVVSYLKTKKELQDPKNLETLLTISKEDQLWISTGRTLGEKSFILFRKGKLKSYGFYELYTQIASLKKLSGLQIEIDFPLTEIENDLKFGLLQGDFEIIAPPLK